MQLSDYFIGKPGPGSLSESIHMGLPVITFRNASTMPQERFNTTWVIEHQYGLVISTMRELPSAVETMIAELPTFKAQVLKVKNRAVFEVVESLERILNSAAL
jgi:1,2-diacylglycerol 3-beta-galactosyltransferase